MPRGSKAALNYALITPAHNEAAFIELTLKSVVAQTRKPVRWVVVNDGSTDNTAEVVSRYAALYPWIELVEMPKREERHFGGKAQAVNSAYQRLSGLQFDVIGNLDADVSFESDYFEFLMSRFAENPRLGVAGTAFQEKNLSYNYELVGIEHVSGMIQMFRRECFEQIGGYSVVRTGGIDLMAVLSARAKGWETRSFLERQFRHHRTQGGALHTGLRGRWYMGRKDYLLGNHPVWEFFRAIYQMQYTPYVIGGLLVLLSYFCHWVGGTERTMPCELIKLRQNDQMKRLKSLVERRLHLTATIL
jgi:glycosyltransferase involved in cell wall biosynthesis